VGLAVLNKLTPVIARAGFAGAHRGLRVERRNDETVRPSYSQDCSTASKCGSSDVRAMAQSCDTYSGHGIASKVRITGNLDAMEKTFNLLQSVGHGFIVTDPGDFDPKCGHRRDV
jgi:phosphopentomutase